MKYILGLVLTFSLPALSQEIDCDPADPAKQILSLATELSLPNCVNDPNISAAKNNDPSKLCTECKSLFESRNDSPLPTLSKDERQSLFVEAALKEYKKNITNSLVDTLKIRSLRPTGSQFQESTRSCKLKTQKDFPRNCSASALKLIGDKNLLKNLEKEVSNELAKLLSTESNFAPSPTLLKRTAPLCHISEKDALYISSSAAEEAFSPDIIRAIQSLDASKYRSVLSMFISEKVSDLYDGEISELFSNLSTHPLMGDHFKTPASLIEFVKSIPEPKDVTQLRAAIYNKKSGDHFDEKLAENCKKGFDSLVNTICSNDFENGNFSLSPFANQSKLQLKEIIPTSDERATSPELVKLNMDALKLCDPNPSSRVSFTAFDTEMNKGLPKRFQSLNLDEFKSQKYDSDIGNNINNICASKDKECSENTIICKMISSFNSLKNPDSVDFKLANSSNKEVNELLRSMIGDTSKIDSKTKEILIAQGIIPRDDGTMVAQADIPERRPDFVQREQAQAKAATSVVQAKQAAASTTNRPGTNRTPASSESFDQGYSNNNTPESQIALPDFSDLMGDQQELRSIQDEIKRRLLGLPEHKPASKADAQRIVRDSFRSRNQALSPQMEDAFANRLMQQAPSASTQGFNNANNPENRAQVSGGETANEKWRKSQDQAALMGMAGAQSVLGKDSSNGAGSAAGAESKPKDLTKVALNITEDPQVRLSDIFNKKIDQNDTETQLLRVLLKKKNNFLLQIKSMNFKVVFDQNNNFNVLLESGDRAEADRIRPQLEMFLKKLKS